MGELFLELGLTWSLRSLSKFSLNISFCTSIIFSKTANMSASACAELFNRMYFDSILNDIRATLG